MNILNIMEEIIQIRSCKEISANGIKIYIIDQYMQKIMLAELTNWTIMANIRRSRLEVAQQL